MVSFEDPADLADLFGVRRTTPADGVGRVRVADNPCAQDMLADLTETEVVHTGQLNQSRYQLAGGVSLLDCVDTHGKAMGPALVLKRGKPASTLLWTVAPTDVARSRNHVGGRPRGETLSELVRVAMGRGMKAIADTPVTTTAGQLLAFWAKDGKLYVVVYENAFPFASRTIHPVVRIRMKGIGAGLPQTTTPYRLGRRTDDELILSMDLAKDELAVFAFGADTKGR